MALLRALLRERSDPALSLLAYRCARARAARPPLKFLTQKCPRKHPRRHSLACIGNRQAGPYLQMPHRGADASDARLSPPLWQVPGAGPASHRPQNPQVLLPCLTRPRRRSRPPEPSPSPHLPPRAAAAQSITMKSMEYPLGCARPRIPLAFQFIHSLRVMLNAVRTGLGRAQLSLWSILAAPGPARPSPF